MAVIRTSSFRRYLPLATASLLCCMAAFACTVGNAPLTGAGGEDDDTSGGAANGDGDGEGAAGGSGNTSNSGGDGAAGDMDGGSEPAAGGSGNPPPDPPAPEVDAGVFVPPDLVECSDNSPVRVVHRAVPPTIDGDFSDWEAPCWYLLAPPSDYVISAAPGVSEARDLSAYTAIQYTSSALFIAVLVADDIHENSQAAGSMWQSDSLQFAFDMGGNGGLSYDVTDDYEFGWALSSLGQLVFRWAQPIGSDPVGTEFFVEREGFETRYEVAIPADELGVDEFPVEGATVSWLINEDDTGLARRGWLQLTDGIGASKTPGDFAPFVFAEPVSDAGAGDGGLPDGGSEDAGAVDAAVSDASLADGG